MDSTIDGIVICVDIGEMISSYGIVGQCVLQKDDQSEQANYIFDYFCTQKEGLGRNC